MTLLAAGCQRSPAPPETQASATPESARNGVPARPNGSGGPVATSHGAAARPPNTDYSQGGTGTAIDTTGHDKEIARWKDALEHTSGAQQAAARKALAGAYLARANALTDARQYRAALGDYRRVLRLDPDNADARQMSDTIISIFHQLGREPPAEGAEPSPLPFPPKS